MMISIVTPSFNQAKFISETIESVLIQNYPSLEYLIVDGGSTDGTIDILRQYDARLSWISEPDKGQAQAINKGFKKTTGDIVAWLNSDDIYLPHALSTVAEFFSQHPHIDLVYGDFYIINQQSKILLRRKEIPFDFNILLYGLDYICQPATFFRCSIFEKIGYLDENLHYGLDWEYWLRLASHGCRLTLLPKYLAAIRWQPQAKTLIESPQLYAEHRTIRERYWDKHRFQSERWQQIYIIWRKNFYRLKRQGLKIISRHTLDFPPGYWMMKKEQVKDYSQSKK